MILETLKECDHGCQRFPEHYAGETTVVISMLEGEKNGSELDTQENSGDVALMEEVEVTNEVFVPLCAEVNMNLIGREQHLSFPKNMLSAEGRKGFTIFPPMNDSKQMLVEDSSLRPTTMPPCMETNQVNTVSRGEVSDSATKSGDRDVLTSLVGDSQACMFITDCQSIVKPSVGKSKKEKGDIVAEFLPQIAKSVDKSHAVGKIFKY